MTDGLDVGAVLGVLAALDGAGVRWWVEGGWGVDALCGERTRAHGRLDLVVIGDEVDTAASALGELGYEVSADERPEAVTLTGTGGAAVGLRLVGRDTGPGLPPEVLTGRGRLGGRPVRCLTAEGQLLRRLSREPDAADHHDVGLLRDRLGLPVPLPFGGAPSPPAQRRATVADALAVAAMGRRTALVAYDHIFPASAPQPTVERLWRVWRGRLADPASVGRVVEEDGAVVGSVVARFDGDGPSGEVAGLYVEPARWCRGLGAAILAGALDDLRDAGAAVAELWVLAGNSRARGVYERRGWQPDGATRDVSTARGVAELRYCLTL